MTQASKIIALFAVVAMLSATPGYASGGEDSQLRVGSQVGNLAPEFTFQDASGKWVSLSDYRGKKVFIFSWSSWCRCKYQLPDLEKFYREYKSDDFEVIAVASDSQGFKWAQVYLDKADATFVALVDPNNELGRTYNFWATENGFLIDESGVIRMRTIGFQISDPSQREELIRLMKTDFSADVSASGPVSPEQKIAGAEAALNADPKNLSLKIELAELYRQNGNLAKAEQTLRSAVHGKRLSARAHYRLGVVLYQQGKVEEALREWKKARYLDPTNYLYMRNIQAYYKPEKFYREVMEE